VKPQKRPKTIAREGGGGGGRLKGARQKASDMGKNVIDARGRGPAKDRYRENANGGKKTGTMADEEERKIKKEEEKKNA